MHFPSGARRGPAPLTLTDAVKAAEAVLTPQHPGVKTWFPEQTRRFSATSVEERGHTESHLA